MSARKVTVRIRSVVIEIDLSWNRAGSNVCRLASTPQAVFEPNPAVSYPLYMQTTERYLACRQKLQIAVNDNLGIEPGGWDAVRTARGGGYFTRVFSSSIQCVTIVRLGRSVDVAAGVFLIIRNFLPSADTSYM